MRCRARPARVAPAKSARLAAKADSGLWRMFRKWERVEGFLDARSVAMSRITDEAEVAERIVDRGTKLSEVVINQEPALGVSAPPPTVENERRAKPRYRV